MTGARKTTSDDQARRAPAPSVAKWQLAGRLRAARDAAEMTIEHAAGEVHVSTATIMRFEKGAAAPGFNDLEAMIRTYGVAEEAADQMKATWQDAKKRSPFAKYAAHRNVDKQWLRYLEFEWSADKVRNFEPLLVPGLLQTQDYSRAVLQVVEHHQKENIETLLKIRSMRQEVVRGRAQEHFPLTQHFILDEAVIRRHVGSTEIMREQLEHLLQDASDESNDVTIQIVPFIKGPYQHLRVGYVLLDLLAAAEGNSTTEQPVLYLEEAIEQLVIHEERATPKSVRRVSVDLDDSILDIVGAEQKPNEYSRVFDDVARDYAASRDQTLQILESAISDNLKW